MKEKIKIMGFKLGKDWEEKIWDDFLEAIKKADKNKTAEILDGILSEKEKKIIAKRSAVISLIRSGKSYKEIEKILWTSSGTISALKKILSEKSTYKSSRFYAIKAKEEKKKNRIPVPEETILDYWASLPIPSKSGYKFNKKRKF